MTSATPPHPFAIVGGRVIPMSGGGVDGDGADGDAIANGTVLIRDGRIEAVGADLAVPDGYDVVDAAGQWVVPGFVESHGHVGIHEEANGMAGNDTNEMTAPVMAGVRAIDAIDIEDEGFRDALAGGITTIVVKPGSGNPVGGQTVAIKSWGGRTIDEQMISDSVSVKSALGENPKRVWGGKNQTPATRLGIALVIRQAFEDARFYAAKRSEAREKGEPHRRDLHLEALVRVLDGDLIWDQHTHRHDDIATAIRLADEFGYRLVVNHGTEGNKIADVLAERNIPVIYGPLFTSRSKVELRDRDMANAGVLARAGVLIAITTDAPVVPINLLVTQASLAAAEGLDRGTALAAITVNPARILGLDARVGALAPGLDADVVLWSGDPLEVTSRAERVYIDGRLVYRWDEAQHRGITVERSERFA